MSWWWYWPEKGKKTNKYHKVHSPRIWIIPTYLTNKLTLRPIVEPPPNSLFLPPLFNGEWGLQILAKWGGGDMKFFIKNEDKVSKKGRFCIKVGNVWFFLLSWIKADIAKLERIEVRQYYPNILLLQKLMKL